jgi:uncharacterized protein YdiU (UPF0061 family)
VLQTLSNLHSLTFDNRFTAELPVDPEPKNFVRQVREAGFSRVRPKQVSEPRLVSYSPEVASLLDLDVSNLDQEEFAAVFAGNRLLPGMDPNAVCYGGHQFGQWAGQLGDGRAINLGEVVNSRGEHWTLQLKGAGKTPYSRRGDGLAVLRSSVREFLCSEAMHHLGVPTTRALSLVLTGDMVTRDMFYDGNPQLEPGAIVCRVAPSFTRFGNFEIFAARDDVETLRKLVDFTIRTDFSHLGEPSASVYADWFKEVCRLTAEMIVHWMRVGFVHGVMNTDNMSVLGLTIDYGPYGWLEDFDPNWTPNTTDAGGRRYAFGRQPAIAAWNLARFAEALLPIVGQAEPLEEGLQEYATRFNEGWRSMMAGKLGLLAFDPASDDELTNELFTILQVTETDMTIFFRKLSEVPVTELRQDARSDDELIAPLADAYYDVANLSDELRGKTAAWLRRYMARVREDGVREDVHRARMNGVNPKYVLRNYLAQIAIDQAEQGDFTEVNDLLDVLRRPYDEQPGRERYAEKRPEWARHRAGCSMLSCSS